MPMSPETANQCYVRSQDQISLTMKVGNNTLQVKGYTQDVWNAVQTFLRLVEPVTFSTQTVPWPPGNTWSGAASAQGIY